MLASKSLGGKWQLSFKRKKIALFSSNCITHIQNNNKKVLSSEVSRTFSIRKKLIRFQSSK